MTVAVWVGMTVAVWVGLTVAVCVGLTVAVYVGMTVAACVGRTVAVWVGVTAGVVVLELHPATAAAGTATTMAILQSIFVVYSISAPSVARQPRQRHPGGAGLNCASPPAPVRR